VGFELILDKIRLFLGEVSNDMGEMLKRRDELKFGDDHPVYESEKNRGRFQNKIVAHRWS
jgi:hypothetical protein